MTKDNYAYPPRGMQRKAAARYLGVEIADFDTLVDEGRMPMPHIAADVLVWDRFEIDLAAGELTTASREDLAKRPC